MFASRILRIAVVLVFAAPALSAAQQTDAADRLREYKAVSRFLNAVSEYVVIHRIVEPLAPDLLCLPEETYAAVNALAAIPLDARPAPRAGDIFLTDVADLFRRRIAGMLRTNEDNVGYPAMNEQQLVVSSVVVNEPLPWGAGNVMLAWLTATLPVLPEDLEYRFVGRDLVLLDLRANIVVDVLRGALPL
jgi:hypothetical protein